MRRRHCCGCSEGEAVVLILKTCQEMPVHICALHWLAAVNAEGLSEPWTAPYLGGEGGKVMKEGATQGQDSMAASCVRSTYEVATGAAGLFGGSAGSPILARTRPSHSCRVALP